MAIINKGTAFSNGEQLTADKLNDLVDLATFDQSATDSASTTVNTSGQIVVKDGGITPAKLSTGAPKWDTSGKLKVGKDTGDGFPVTHITASRQGTTDILELYSNDSIKFKVTSSSDSEKMRIDEKGRVLLGVSTSPTNVSNSIVCSGRIATQNTYSQTSSASANLVINSDGLLQRSTSSGRYKENVEDYDKGIEAIKSLRPVTYQSINEDDDSTYAGFIAEEVDEAGLTEFVDYNPEGQPDALHYANMNALLTKALQEAIARIEILEAK